MLQSGNTAVISAHSAKIRRQTSRGTFMSLHKGIKPYKCTLCTKSFGQKLDLNLHLFSHTGIPHMVVMYVIAVMLQKIS